MYYFRNQWVCVNIYSFVSVYYACRSESTKGMWIIQKLLLIFAS